jgi:diguanylate cyclase (GGDEF)-like protein/putative nucleotidyltransferase with HDIG domain
MARFSGHTRSLAATSIPPARLEATLMARVLAGLFAAGATLAMLTVALPHSPHANILGLLLIVADAYLTALLLVWRAAAVPRWMLPITLACGTTLIAGVAYFSARTPSPLIFFFLWVFVYSAYFLTPVESALQISYLGLMYGALLVMRPAPGGAVEWWVVGMATLAVAAAVVRLMRKRGEELVARLYDAGRKDPLTGLSNRRGFRELLDLELERARRGETELTVVIGDVDHLKETNDRSGQHVGDAVLLGVAKILDPGKRPAGAVARVAGQRFAVILPDTSAEAGYLVAERLRLRTREELDGHPVGVTISFGLATFPRDGQTAGSLLRATDLAIHSAKQLGRDRTVLFNAGLRGPEGTDGDPRDVAGERFMAVVLDLAEAVDLRFSGSARHSETVGGYAASIARELGLAEPVVERVRLAGILHDVGKVGVPDSILKKPGRLTSEEFDTIKKHPELGAQILAHPCLEDVSAWVAAHHERPDGGGYPLGLTGGQIPIQAQIVAVADSYEAMTSDRSYRPSIGHVAAQAELRGCAGKQFDPRVVRAFLAVLARETAQAERSLVAVAAGD